MFDRRLNRPNRVSDLTILDDEGFIAQRSNRYHVMADEQDRTASVGKNLEFSEDFFPEKMHPQLIGPHRPIGHLVLDGWLLKKRVELPYQKKIF